MHEEEDSFIEALRVSKTIISHRWESLTTEFLVIQKKKRKLETWTMIFSYPVIFINMPNLHTTNFSMLILALVCLSYEVYL